jgi:hypothetical protein
MALHGELATSGSNVLTITHQHFRWSLRVQGRIEAATNHPSILTRKVRYQPSSYLFVNLVPGIRFA